MRITHHLNCFVLAFAIFCSVVICLATSMVAQETEGTAKTVPVFKDGQAQVVEGFSDSSEWIHHDLWVETEFNTDGDDKLDRMHVSVCRQKQTDTEGLKVPVIYNTSPYFSGTGDPSPKYMWNPRQELGAEPPEHPDPPHIKQRSNRPSISTAHNANWLPRGYAVVHSCSPGTGLSQGCPTVGGMNEALAPKAVIDWLCGRARGFTTVDGNEEVFAKWCTGKIGMTGTSYNGTLPLAAATTGVEGLEAIIPVAPNTSYYHYYRSNGLIRHPGGYMGEDIDILYNFINSGDIKKREFCDCEIRDKEMANGFDRVDGDYNEFWAGRDYLNQLSSLKAATIMAHGFNDWNVMPEHSVRIYDALNKKGVPCQAFFHQGGHGGPPPMKIMNRWFTRYLHGVENGVENDAKSWVVRENDSNDSPTAYDDYPHPQASDVQLHLGADGNKLGTLGTEKATNLGVATIVDDVKFTGKKLARAEQSQNRLLYATPTLKSDLHLSGTSRISIKLACDKPAANLSVWMVSLPFTNSRKPNDNIITRGWADPQNHKSLSESEPLEPGKFYELNFELQPDDQVIPAGQRIGLMIFSSDRDFTLWPEPGTELTVDLDATSIEIPVVGGSEAFRNALNASTANQK